MKTLFKAAILVLALIFGLMIATPSAHALNHFTIDVYEDTGFSSTAGGYPALADDVWYHVLDAGTTTTETIYSDTASTSMTNPVLKAVYDVDGNIDFYTGTADTTVDIWITDLTTGSSTFINGATTSTKRVIINNKPLVDHVSVMYYSMSTTSSYETDGTWDTEIVFPANTMIKDVFVYVLASGSIDCDLDVGLGEQEDGLIHDVRMTLSDTLDAAPGWYQPDLLCTSGLATDHLHGLYGELLAEGDGQGADSNGVWASTSSNEYFRTILRPHLMTAASSLNYTVQSSAETGTGWIFVVFQMIQP